MATHSVAYQTDLFAENVADINFCLRSAGIADDDDSAATTSRHHAGIDGRFSDYNKRLGISSTEFIDAECTKLILGGL